MNMNDKPVVVYTYGVFDLLHIGHLRLLEEAKGLGDKLVVGIFTDDVATSFKRLPIVPEDQRAEMIRNLKCVDEVVMQDELQPDKNLLRLKPDVLAKGPGAGWEYGQVLPGSETMARIGGKVILLNYHGFVSTSAIIDKIWKSQQQSARLPQA